MKRLIMMAAIAGGLAVSACQEPAAPEQEVAPPPMEAPVAPAATDQAADAAATGAATDQPPADTTRLPTDSRTSEESVRPESETLFY